MRFTTLTAAPAADEVRLETHRGRTYLVAPVVMVREGVLNGGYLSFDEIQRSVPGWNGRPVTAPPSPDHSGHPTDERGEFVSANQEPYLSTMHVGRVQGVEARTDLSTENGESPNGLVGTVWYDIEAAKDVGTEAVEVVRRLANGEKVEVSTGYWHGYTQQSGTFEGEPYSQVQFDLMPDHLAVLPNETGACSWADGCGAPRANAADDAMRSAVNAVVGERVLAVNNDGDDDVPPADGADDAVTILSRIRGLVGTNGTDGTTGQTGANTGDSHTMDNDRLQALAARTAFDVDTLSAMSDEQVDALEQTLDEADDAGTDTPPAADGGTDPDGTDPDPDGTDLDPDEDDEGTEGAQNANAAVETLQRRIEALEQRAEAAENEARAVHVETITANTDRTVEDLDGWPLDALETLAEQVAPRGPAPMPTGNRVNYLGQAGRGAAANGTDDSAEVDEWTSSVGALSTLAERERGGDN